MKILTTEIMVCAGCDMSLVVRKPAFTYIRENKNPDQLQVNRKADQHALFWLHR